MISPCHLSTDEQYALVFPFLSLFIFPDRKQALFGLLLCFTGGFSAFPLFPIPSHSSFTTIHCLQRYLLAVFPCLIPGPYWSTSFSSRVVPSLCLLYKSVIVSAIVHGIRLPRPSCCLFSSVMLYLNCGSFGLFYFRNCFVKTDKVALQGDIRVFSSMPLASTVLNVFI